jgi:RNA polymerase sigma-70 factor (ECF subfamily)
VHGHAAAACPKQDRSHAAELNESAPALRGANLGSEEATSMTGVDLPSLLVEMLPRLWAFGLRISGNRHDAEDLVQRACVRALERAHQLREDTSPLSWVFSIMHSIWINELRARKVRNRNGVEWDDQLLETVADPDASNPETEVLHRQVLRAIERLPEAQRAVILLVAIEGFSYKEAADVLEVPIGTVMSRLSRARQALATLFDGQPAESVVRKALGNGA